MITLKNLVKDFPSSDGTTFRALHSVSLDIDEGEYVAVMGPSGSGKSTLMNIVGLLDRPTSGTYLLEGRPVDSLAADEAARVRCERIGFVFQGYNLIPRLSALEQVEMPLRYRGFRPAERRRLAMAALERVGLANRAASAPTQLSGGQQQRVAIARAVAGSPAVILADEPTGALDSKTGAEVLALFGELNREGSTVVVITHSDEVGAAAGRMVRFRDGRVVSDSRNS